MNTEASFDSNLGDRLRRDQPPPSQLSRRGGADGAETYVLIANPTPAAGRVTVTALFEDGTTAARSYDLPASSRTNVPMSVDFPSTVTHGRFGAIVESVGLVPVPVIVERSTYASPGSVTWSSGASALASPIP